MSAVYNEVPSSDSPLFFETVELLCEIIEQTDRVQTQKMMKQSIRQLNKNFKLSLSPDFFVRFWRVYEGQFNLPKITPQLLEKVRLKPMRSQSGIQSVSVLTKPFPCPGKCIFCPNDVRMPKSYIASEPGAQRAERNSFDPYLQTYSRLQALHNIGHNPSKVELIVLGGTWSYYPESYQVWFVKECFRALNDFSEGENDTERILKDIDQTVKTQHRQQNRMVNDQEISVDGKDISKTYNQIVSQHYLAPEQLAEGQAVPRREQASWAELYAEHHRNERATSRCVGLTLETRPDNISVEEVIRLRKLGTTKTQIGFQSLSDDVLEKNKRGHDTQATRRAVALLRQAGFKIHAHWMPNLYGSNVASDIQEFAELFNNPAYKPDELKVYPCALIPSAELMAYYQRGEWAPYTEDELNEVIRFALLNAPEWARLTRVVRDIPSTEVAAGNIKTNMRQLLEDQLKQEGKPLKDIRGREIRGLQPVAPIRLTDTVYQTSTSTEHFLQFVDAENHILGFLRLSLPIQPSIIPELGSNAIIRELHVYGGTEAVGSKEGQGPQHQGLGKQLLQRAAQVAQENMYTTLSVISAIGTKDYYRKRGFVDGELYQHLALN